MQKIFIIMLLAGLLATGSLQAQTKGNTGGWYLEAGPYIGVAEGVFHLSHSVGFGLDARIAHDFGDNFSGGGKITYAYFFGKDLGGIKAKGFNMMRLYANIEYATLATYNFGIRGWMRF